MLSHLSSYLGGRIMGKFRLYHIQDEYIEFLHKIDRRVQFNKSERRPYVGVVLEIGGIQYYVPLESPKPNHVNIKSGGPVLKLDEGRLGIMGFNNMIPVDRHSLVEFDIQKETDERYRRLLNKQLACCEKSKDVIFARAASTYNKQVAGKIPLYRKVCCDFKKLEANMGLFKPQKRRRK